MQYSIAACFLVSFLLSWGALSTYWKKDVDAVGWNWFLHGLGIGLAFLPFIYVGIPWEFICVRAFTLGLLMMMWSEINDNVVWEECGRGALIVLTLPILLL